MYAHSFLYVIDRRLQGFACHQQRLPQAPAGRFRPISIFGLDWAKSVAMGNYLLGAAAVSFNGMPASSIQVTFVQSVYRRTPQVSVPGSAAGETAAVSAVPPLAVAHRAREEGEVDRRARRAQPLLPAGAGARPKRRTSRRRRVCPPAASSRLPAVRYTVRGGGGRRWALSWRTHAGGDGRRTARE